MVDAFTAEQQAGSFWAILTRLQKTLTVLSKLFRNNGDCPKRAVWRTLKNWDAAGALNVHLLLKKCLSFEALARSWCLSF